MKNQRIKEFIKQHEHLLWYTPANEKENISDELLLENILNYADLATIKEFFRVMGIKKVKTVFKNLTGRKKGNLYPEIYHLFSEHLKRLA